MEATGRAGAASPAPLSASGATSHGPSVALETPTGPGGPQWRRRLAALRSQVRSTSPRSGQNRVYDQNLTIFASPFDATFSHGFGAARSAVVAFLMKMRHRGGAWVLDDLIQDPAVLKNVETQANRLGCCSLRTRSAHADLDTLAAARGEIIDPDLVLQPRKRTALMVGLVYLRRPALQGGVLPGVCEWRWRWRWHGRGPYRGP